MTAKLHGLDHLRALAIVMVFAFHYGALFTHPGWMPPVTHFGWTGVDLFFVLSGYLIASQLFKAVINTGSFSLKTFVIKRFFRIVPAYVFTLAWYVMVPAFREREALAPLWKYLTFTQNIELDISKQGTFSHAWSLCIEEQFYLLFPLVILLLLRFKVLKRGGILLGLLFVFGLGIRLYTWHFTLLPFEGQDGFRILWYKWIYYPSWCRLDGLLFGVGIAALEQFKPGVIAAIKSNGNWCLLLSLVLLIWGYFICDRQETFTATVFGFILVDVGFGFLVLAAISPQCFLYKGGSKITASIAALSYGIYLSHKIVIHVTQGQLIKVGIDPHGNVSLLICTMVSVIVAVALNRVIEKPFLRLRDRVLYKR